MRPALGGGEPSVEPPQASAPEVPADAAIQPISTPEPDPAPHFEPEPEPDPAPQPAPEDRRTWLDKLRGGLRKTGTSITQVFTGTRIDDALYEELESALLMADAGVKATEFLLVDLKRRVKDAKATDPSAVKGLLAAAITDLLQPLERGLVVGRYVPTVVMVVGV